MCQLLGARDEVEVKTDEVSAPVQCALRVEAIMNKLND